MKTRFRKIAVASAVTAALAGVSLPSHAIITGIAGEGLLVPLAIWAGNDRNNLNTLIEIEVPASIGWEDAANIYTAPNTTPTNANLSMGFNPDVFKPVVIEGNTRHVNAIHWFIFNHRSGHVKNDSVPVTPDDVIQLNFHDMLPQVGFADEPHYVVITNEIGYTKAGKENAQFSMFGDAWLVNDNDFEAEIPVLPLADAADATAFPVWGDHIIYQPNGIPAQVSPLASGNLSNYADGVLGDFSVWDVPLSTNDALTYHVLWLDLNRDLTKYGVGSWVDVEVFDTEERSCSDAVRVPDELQIICIDPDPENDDLVCDDLGELAQHVRTEAERVLPTDYSMIPCMPNGAISNDGFIQYQPSEAFDRGSNTAESANVFFAIMNRTIGAEEKNDFVTETALARYRGTYKSK
jgi:hypothetical protein